MQWDHHSHVVLHWLLFCGCLYSHSSVIQSRAEKGATELDNPQNTFQTLWNSQNPTPRFIIAFSVSKNLCVYAQSYLLIWMYALVCAFVYVCGLGAGAAVDIQCLLQALYRLQFWGRIPYWTWSSAVSTDLLASESHPLVSSFSGLGVEVLSTMPCILYEF